MRGVIENLGRRPVEHVTILPAGRGPPVTIRAVAGISHEPIDPYLEALVAKGGTDLLLTAGAPPLVRIDGRVTPLLDVAPLTAEDTQAMVLGVLGDGLRAAFAETKDVDLSFNWAGRARFRANAFMQRGSMALALRLIPYQIPSFEDLGLPETC